MTVVSYIIPPSVIPIVRRWPGVSINENVNLNGWAFAILNPSQIDAAVNLGALPYEGQDGEAKESK